MVINLIGCGRFASTAIEIMLNSTAAPEQLEIYLFDERDQSTYESHRIALQEKLGVVVKRVVDFNELSDKGYFIFGTGIPDVKLRYLSKHPTLVSQLSIIRSPQTVFSHPDRNITGGGLSATGVLTGPNCKIEVGFTLDVGVIIAHDSTVGRGCTLGPYSILSGGAVLGDGCFVESHCVIGPDVEIPSGTHLFPGTICAKTISKTGVYFGNPARRLK